MVMRLRWHHWIILTKSLQRTFSQHLSFQSVNSNTRVGCERCLWLIKKDTSQKKVNYCSTLIRFEQRLHLV